MVEIRFVGTGETRGYPYLVCKKGKYRCHQLVKIFNQLLFQIRLADLSQNSKAASRALGREVFSNRLGQLIEIAVIYDKQLIEIAVIYDKHLKKLFS